MIIADKWYPISRGSSIIMTSLGLSSYWNSTLKWHQQKTCFCSPFQFDFFSSWICFSLVVTHCGKEPFLVHKVRKFTSFFELHNFKNSKLLTKLNFRTKIGLLPQCVVLGPHFFVTGLERCHQCTSCGGSWHTWKIVNSCISYW